MSNFEPEIGTDVWFARRYSWGVDVYSGEVAASGPKWLVVLVRGPWRNIVEHAEVVARSECQFGRCPAMQSGEVRGEYVDRCMSIICEMRTKEG
jgi:hypothetical protein